VSKGKGKELTLDADKFHLEVDLAGWKFVFRHKLMPGVGFSLTVHDNCFSIEPEGDAKLCKLCDGGIIVQ